MAEIVISSFLSVIFEKLASAAYEKLAPHFETSYETEKLERSALQIRSVLADASQKETTNQAVKHWLNALQHLAYDIDDVLDEIATEAMHRELNDESETHTSKVRKLFPNPFSKHSSSTRTMKNKINAITTRLQDLIEEKDTLGLVVKEETRSKDINRSSQTSLINSSSIVGRQAEKEALVHKLLLDEPCGQNFGIVPIVGMGGVGKTTLARLVYDDERVKEHFKLCKAWVCVSDEFDIFGISKVIFQSVARKNEEFTNLNLLQEALRDHLREKRFLLVLDDVWSESCRDWDTLVAPFHACAPGSKIIMTTRKDQLLKKLGYNNIHQLGSLSHDDAMSLFALHALGVNDFGSHLSLKPHGVGIVKKCKGLPLALIALGRLLRTKKAEEEYWKEVLNSEIWRLQDGGEIIPALRLSYHDLPAHLKQLFAYCSLFPKDYVFDKEQLVHLWMAEGFLRTSIPSDSTEESLGHEYFDELLSRSFFQHEPNNESLFVMHDLMNDLAIYVAGEFFLRLEKDIRKEALETYRHMSFVLETYVPYKKFEAFERAKSLRTVLAMHVGVVNIYDCFFLSKKILDDLLPKLPLLRVLCLSNYDIVVVPETIGTLRHLRYLNLSRTRITQLPENVCNLYNLQMMILSCCHYLAKLPKSFLKLKKLLHFDIRDTPLLEKMPLGISELTNLQTLSKVNIGVEDGTEINKLKDLKNLRGKISIVGLEKVQNAIHAQEMNISQKRLSELEFVWSDVSDGSRNKMLEKEVLNELKPGTGYLKQLEIVSYGALEFPKWVGDPFFLRLNHVSLRGCKSCTSLPPLGQLPSLKELFIDGLCEVKVVGMELLGTSRAFPSLEILSFKNMPRWEKWSMNSGVVFPCVQKLEIKDCPNLVEVTLEALRSLEVLDIYKCDSGVLRRLVQVASAVIKLDISFISGLNDVVWRGVTEYIGAVRELRITECNRIRYLWESEAVASKVLVNIRNLKVEFCRTLVSLGEIEDNCRSNLITSLRMLEVLGCRNMERCSCPDSIETLIVELCRSVTTISLPRQNLKSLQIDECDALLEREWGGQMTNNNRSTMLEDVKIEGWRNLKSIVELNYLVHLTKLSIVNCESLESFPDNELPNLTSLKKLEIRNCPRMDACFPRGFWPPKLQSLTIGKLKKPITEWGQLNFPTSLVDLELYGGEDGVSSCSQFSHLLPSSLTHLTMEEFDKLESVSMGLQHLTSLQLLSFYECPNLKKLSHAQHLTSLQHLLLDKCPNIMDLPEMSLPSLLRLRMNGCPNLKERCSEGGDYWPLISHIPCLLYDGRHVNEVSSVADPVKEILEGCSVVA